MRRAEAGREGLGIVGTPIPGAGLPGIDLEPRGKGAMNRHGSGRRTVLVRCGSQDVVQDELIPRGELGDNLIMSPRKTLLGNRTDISGMRSTRDVLGRGRDGRKVSDGDAHRLPGAFGPGPVVLGSEVVGVRWQALVKIGGRRRAGVERSSEEDVLSVLE